MGIWWNILKCGLALFKCVRNMIKPANIVLVSEPRMKMTVCYA